MFFVFQMDRGNLVTIFTNVTKSQKKIDVMVEFVIKMILKGRKESNKDMFPEPTELLLVGCSTETI